MSLPAITSFLPKHNSDIDLDIEQKARLHAVKAMRYALDKTMNQLNNGELLVDGSMGNNNVICDVFQYYVNAYLDDNLIT
jgi:hypothetical protein